MEFRTHLWGKVRYGSARTIEAAIRAAIQHSAENLQMLATRHGDNPKIGAKWRKRATITDSPRRPVPASTVRMDEGETLARAVCRGVAHRPRAHRRS